MWGESWCQLEREGKSLAKVAECHLQVTRGVDEKVAGLQVPMKHIGRMDVFQPSENLVEKVADVVIAELLGLQQLIEIGFHQILNYISAEGEMVPPPGKREQEQQSRKTTLIVVLYVKEHLGRGRGNHKVHTKC